MSNSLETENRSVLSRGLGEEKFGVMKVFQS